MKINVPPAARAHFWVEPPPGSVEFWAFPFRPPCVVGERLSFRFDGREVASAVVSRLEAPGRSACEGTGRYGSRWKVFWHPDSFVDRRGAGAPQEGEQVPAPGVQAAHADESPPPRHPDVTTEAS